MKLALLEEESRALFAHLRDKPERVTSIVTTVEVPRAVRRSSTSSRALQRATQVVRRHVLIDLREPIRTRAAAILPPHVRALDGIHIATALDLGDALEAMITYDERQGAAAREAGLQVLMPGRDEG